MPSQHDSNQKLTIRDAANHLNVSTKTVRRWIKNGTLKTERAKGQRGAKGRGVHLIDKAHFLSLKAHVDGRNGHSSNGALDINGHFDEINGQRINGHSSIIGHDIMGHSSIIGHSLIDGHDINGQPPIIGHSSQIAGQKSTDEHSNLNPRQLTDITATYHLLAHHTPVEIRVIGPARGTSRSNVLDDFTVTDLSAFITACAKWDTKGNIYVGSRERRNNFQPTPTTNGGWFSAKKRDITAMTVIPVDIDATRPKGLGKQATTEAELQHALDAAEHLCDQFFLKRQLLPPVRAMSGNGVQLWLCIPRYEIPKDGWYQNGKSEYHLIEDATKALFEDLKQALPASFKDKVSIDSIFDLTRIIKVIGTTSIKGDPQTYPDRPHRVSHFIDEPVRREDQNLLQYILNYKQRQSTHTHHSRSYQRDSEKEKASQPPPGRESSAKSEARVKLPERFRQLLESHATISHLWQTPCDDRSTHDWKLGRACIDAGLTDPADLRAILMHNPHGKWTRDRRFDYLDLTVSKLLASRRHRVWEVDNRYWVFRRKDEQLLEVPITTFVMNLQRQITSPSNELIREMAITNQFGEHIDSVQITATDMATPMRFREFLYRQPIPLKFEGSGADLIDLIDLVLTQSCPQTITELTQVGRITIEQKPVWAFEDLMISNGTAIYPDADGIFCVNGKGYRLRDLFGTGLPELPQMGEHRPPDVKNLNDLRRHTAMLLHNNLGFDGLTLIGWVGATLYSHVVRKRYKNFPLLFAVGSREAGKNVFGEWVMSFFRGLSPHGATSTTRVGFERAFEYYCHLPVWVEEYRNIKAVTAKDSLFRAVYDGVADLKGKRGEGGIIRKPQACVLITGEEVPRDNALLSRCAVVWLSKTKRNTDPELFELINDISQQWPALTRDILLTQTAESEQAFIHEVQRVNKQLTTITSERQRRNFAIIAAGLKLFTDNTDEYITYLLEEGKRQQELKEADSLLSEFVTDLEAMHLQELIPSQYYHVDGDGLYLQLKSIYNLWEGYYRRRRGESPLGYRSLLGYLSETPYFREASALMRHGSRVGRYVVLSQDGAKEVFGFLFQPICNS